MPPIVEYGYKCGWVEWYIRRIQKKEGVDRQTALEIYFDDDFDFDKYAMSAQEKWLKWFNITRITTIIYCLLSCIGVAILYAIDPPQSLTIQIIASLIAPGMLISVYYVFMGIACFGALWLMGIMGRH